MRMSPLGLAASVIFLVLISLAPVRASETSGRASDTSGRAPDTSGAHASARSSTAHEATPRSPERNSSPTLAASCQPSWLPTFGTTQSTNAGVLALTEFDDGSGPTLYVGGQFTAANGIPANHVAKWNHPGWSPLAGGINGDVLALAVFDDGPGGNGPALYAGGTFTVPTSRIAKWDGSSWSSVGGGVNGSVTALATFDDGSGPALYAGGSFQTAGGAPSPWIARWNGSSWSSVGGGTDSVVHAFEIFDDGSGPALYAGGTFHQAGGAPANAVAKWNGSSWSALSFGADSFVLALCTYDDGSGPALYAGGGFSSAGGVPASRIAKWNGSSWSALGSGITLPSIPTLARVLALSVLDDGGGPRLIAGGIFSHAGGNPASNIARWNGSAWSPLGGGMSGEVDAFAVFDDGHGPALFAGGRFGTAFDSGDAFLAKWGCPSTRTDPFCYGDGSGAPCPCANNGAPGHGCDNSAATGGAQLAATGTTSPDALVLGSSGELASALSVFLQGSVEIAPVNFGDGLRCAGGNLKRLFVKNAVSGTATAPDFGAGDPTISARSAALGDPYLPGSVRVYQVYYRDPNLAFCATPPGDAWNVSNGLRVTW
jgi:hypothetical protein